jgi:cytochrome c-type biogenesis protein CcmH/NrfG
MLREAALLAPDDPWLVVTAADVMQFSGDLEGARREYVKAATLFPDYVPGYLGLGSLALQMDKVKEAEAILLKVVAIQPTNLEAARMLGRIYLEGERFEDGIKAYTHILHYEPQDIEGLLALGICHVAAEDTAAARGMFERVLEIDPENKTAQENLAVVSGTGSN